MTCPSGLHITDGASLAAQAQEGSYCLCFIHEFSEVSQLGICRVGVAAISAGPRCLCCMVLAAGLVGYFHSSRNLFLSLITPWLKYIQVLSKKSKS